jgi:transmembrane 9 superfamily protein 2/4
MCLYNTRVHGDVFRPPQRGMLLSVLIGNGVQIAIMSLITLSKVIFTFISISLFVFI